MNCPSCGATITQRDQRYCQDCGTALAAASAPTTAIAPRSPGVDLPATGMAHGWLQLLPADRRNRMLVGAGAAVLAVFVLYVVVNAIVSFLLHLVLPAVVVLALLYGGYRYLRARTP